VVNINKSQITKAQEGNEEAIIEIVQHYDNLIWHLIHSLHFYDHTNKDNNADLHSAGRLGIITAINTYNNTKSSLTTWVYTKIRAALQYCITNRDTIRVPFDKRITGNKIETTLYYEDTHQISIASPTDDQLELVQDIMLFLNKRFKKHYSEIYFKYFFEQKNYKELDEEYGIHTKQVIYKINTIIRKEFYAWRKKVLEK